MVAKAVRTNSSILHLGIYFKVDDANHADYEKQGSKSYWQLPEEIMEDRDELEMWIAKSVKANIKDKKSSSSKKK